MNNRKIIAFMLSLTILCPVGSIAIQNTANTIVASASEEVLTPTNESYFTINNNGAITKYTGTETNVVIPSTINGINVTRIEANAFKDNTSITSVVIPQGVTSIGGAAFNNCQALTSIEIPNSVTSIGYSAFDSCKSLASIKIPENVTSIGNSAFSSCKVLTSIKIPENVTSIGNFTFYGCTALKSIRIPDSVTSIGIYAFQKCTSLTSIEIPSSVTSIGNYAFAYCDSLNTVYVCNSSIDSSKFKISNNGDVPENIFYFDETTGTITKYIGSATNVEIPSTINGIKVTAIGEYAFIDCTALASVKIPSSVTSIGDYAFYNCQALTSIEIPSSVTSIGNYAFTHCDSLNTVYVCNSSIDSDRFKISTDGKLPENIFYFDETTGTITKYIGSATNVEIPSTINGINVTTIGDNAFNSCTSLTSIEISEGVTSIGEYAFTDCTALASVKIPSSVTSINEGAFCRCSALKSVEILNGLKTIGDSAFMNCTALTDITIPDSVTTICENAFSDCTALTSIELPDNIKTIQIRTFLNCKSLASVKLPKNLTSIEAGAFSNCTLLKDIEIPNGVTQILDGAFKECESLEEITIPNSVTSIGRGVFIDCTSLKSITIPSSITVSNFDDIVFLECTNLDTIYVCNSSFDKSNSSKFKISNDGTLPENIFYFDETTGTITGYTGSDTELEIPSTINGVNVTTIGKDVFRDCTFIESIQFPEGLTSFSECSFYGCTSLTEIHLPDSLVYTGNNSFGGCTNLKTVTFGENSKLKNIDYGTFISCPSLESINIPNTVELISGYAFNGCKSLKNIKIPSSVTKILNYAFENCTSLIEINIPNGVKTIEARVFKGCTSLKDITIPNSVVSIDTEAFANCTSLTVIKIPNSVDFLYGSAFSGCFDLDVVIDRLKSECTKYYYLDQNTIINVYYLVMLENNLNNVSSSNIPENNRISSYENYTTTLTVDDQYTLSKDDIVIKVGDTILEDGYTFVDGVLTISRNKLTDNITIDATAKLKEYSVTSDLTNIKSNGTDKISHGNEYKATLTADDGYTLPSDITIKVGDTVLKDGYTFVDGVLTISGEKVTGNITIEATGKLKEYSVTSDLTNIKSNGTDKISHGKEYKATLTADDGYNLPSDITVKVGDTVLKDGYTFVDGVLTISGEKVTGNITIEATGKLKEYSVTSDLTNIKSNGTDKVSHGKEYKATLNADDGYNLPSDITVKVGDTVLKDGYTFVDGVLTISGEKVTGNITIEATGKLKEYSVTSDLTNIKSNGTDKVSHGKEYKATLNADDGYNLPSDITVKVGDTVLKDGYTFVDGVLTISGEKVTGNITINAIGNKKHTSIDLLRLKKHILGISTIEDITSLDLNNDGTLNILDVIAFKNKLLNE